MRSSVISKLPFVLVFFIVVCIAAATLIENRFGTDYALHHVYGALWFIVLWGLLVVHGCRLMYKRKLWKRLPVFLLHLSFLIILAGALTTHITSRRGMVHLREGEATRTCWVKNEQGLYMNTEELPFYLALKDFQIQYDADGLTPSDYVSQVVLSTQKGKEEATISMNNIGRVDGFRIYQTSYDDDEQGSVFTVSYDPWGTAITYAGYLLLALSMVWVSVFKVHSSQCIVHSSETEKKSQFSILNSQFSTAFLAVCGTAMASYMVIAICRSPLVPILRSPYLFVHVGTIMLSYILLVVSIIRREVLRPAVFLLTTGIFLGAVWANVSWGTYWSWDPKESWALITLLVYSVPLHTESLPWFRSTRNYRIYSLVALACLLMTYFGVNFLLGGMHSYAG